MKWLFTLLLLFAATAALAADSNFTFVIRDTGGRVDWGRHNVIAFDRPDANNWSQVWTMLSDGSKQKCLTCGPEYSKLHNGNPAWHPSGKFIVYQSLDEKIKKPLWGGLYHLYTSPGAGVNNNLMIVTADGSQHWQLTNLGKGKGVLHPHFSHDGKRLLWAEMTSTSPLPTGQWVMRLAEFKLRDGVPSLGDIRTLQPGGMQFYETHSFSPDDATILFTGKSGSGNFDIYKYHIATQELAALTDVSENFWDEHAQFSPDGKKILWMSSKDNDGSQKGAFVKTDWWIIDADGSNKRRLTFFNKKGAQEYIKGKAIAADISWSPDGKKAIGYLQDNSSAEKPGHIVAFSVP